jgi:hypothetical protein
MTTVNNPSDRTSCLFAAAFGAGAIGATWNPNNAVITVKGYQSVVTQAWVGLSSTALVNLRLT